jgi:hypothetical protein
VKRLGVHGHRAKEHIVHFRDGTSDLMLNFEASAEIIEEFSRHNGLLADHMQDLI